MKLPSLTQIAKGIAQFSFYRDGVLYYDLLWFETDNDCDPELLQAVPIAVEDAGSGEFLPEMKGMNVLRWARKHVDMIRKSQEQQDAAEEEIRVDPYETYKEGLSEDPQG